MVSKKTRFLTITAILSAFAAVLQFLEFPIPFLIPTFVKFDFSDLPALIAAFLVSPLSGVAVCVVKNIVHLLFTQSAGIGELANALIGIVMVISAGLIYRRKPTRRAALVGCIVGSLTAAVLSVFVNYYISYPFYMRFTPLETILELYRELNGGVGTLWDALILFNAPFTLLKFAIVSAITFAVYKPLSNAVKRVWGAEGKES
ncbi:MAG: ECF transporter S component [Bacteroides sp.]|nr:ECF transporter S component [Eubacterium sp.]MCM1418560.1 ECF transporter S component [Roseburia sp.]MCM1462615.1 ECF transporter S component [Bacteroides sp.]